MKPIVAFWCLTLAPCPALADKWTATDTVAEVGRVGLLMIDWSQSLDRRFRESNSLLPAEPNRGVVTTYFLAAISGQLLVARLLPHPWRRVFQVVVIGAHSVAHNWQMGAQLSWCAFSRSGSTRV
jgi:hypothetical protein